MLKKRLGKIMVVTTMAVTLLASSFAFGASKPADKNLNAVSQTTSITWDQAKAKVMNRLQGGVLKYMRSTTDDGIKVYEGKATRGNYVYDFKIRKSNGRWKEWDGDYEGSRTTAGAIGSNFTKADVIAKVRNRVSNATIIYVKLTKDDGRWVYEGEAYKNGYLYDFEMNAYSGRIIEWDRDWAF